VYFYACIPILALEFVSARFYDSADRCTEWQKCIGCLKLQVSFRKRATYHKAHLHKMTYKDKASSPPYSHFSSKETFGNDERRMSPALPRLIGLFYGKWPMKMRHLRHPVIYWVINSSNLYIYIYIYTYTYIYIYLCLLCHLPSHDLGHQLFEFSTLAAHEGQQCVARRIQHCSIELLEEKHI